MSPRLIDHFQNPRNVGELPAPAVQVEVSNPVCGDELRLSVLFQNGRVAQVRYRVRGCTASIAAGSALTELLLANAFDEITAADVEQALGGLSSASKHAAALCVDAVGKLRCLGSQANS